MNKLHELANLLLEKETVEADEFYALFGEAAPEKAENTQQTTETEETEQ